MTHGLGRRHAPDERDERFPLRTILPAATTRTWRYWWDLGLWGDQGNRPQCVGYAWAHWIEDASVTFPDPGAELDPTWIYRRAQQLDEWAGENYDGTSVRGGVKAIAERGFAAEYRWAWDIDTVILALLEEGPVVVGTTWYEGMFDPDERGFLHASGRVVGGHAYMLNGINVREEKVRLKNSWGRGWGHLGRAWLRFNTLEHLLRDYGEACYPVPTRPPV